LGTLWGVSGTTDLGEVAANKSGYVKPKKKATARAVTEPVVGQMAQTKALDTRLGDLYTTV
jgi:hypothetical protein